MTVMHPQARSAPGYGEPALSQSSSRSAAEPDPKYLASSSTAATSAAAASSVSSKSGSS